MKAAQMRELGAEDIVARVAELERERFNLQFRAGTQTLDDPLRLRVIRRELARLKTILREKTTGTAAVGAARTGGK
ncbi:MAG TPA: 50S ribosomal protein L29 [Gemmatimonadaceae bacterium]|nr:50S ribosomal protein L29 [Gemmatimonadaceae bacterium]